MRADRQADAILAASRITHVPVNSPVLYVDADRLPSETFAEMKRLGPDGNTYDFGVQVYLVGPISENIEREVQDELGSDKQPTNSVKTKGVFMNVNSWLWIALIAFLVFCCLPMLFMGRHRKSPDDAAKEEDRNSQTDQ